MVKKLKYLLLLLPFLFTLNVKAVQFGTGGYSCVYFENGGNYCSPVTSFTYNNNTYYGANYSYDPDLLDITGETVLDFNNQSFCSNQTSGGTLTFRLYHNYDFEENPIDHIRYRLNSTITNYCSTTYNRNGRYSDITCNFPNSFSNSTLSLIYQFNDIGINFPFTAGASNVSISENCGFSTSDVVNNQNQNTNSIINNQNQNTTTITQNQDDNTQDIIDNQNQNTQDIIDNQNKVFGNICYNNLFNKNSPNKLNAYISSNGSIISNDNARLIYINISPNTTYTISKILSSRFVVSSYVSQPVIGSRGTTTITDYNANYLTITTGSNDYYLAVWYFSYNDTTITETDILNSLQITKGNKDLPYTNYGEENCVSKLDEQNNSINNLNDSINSTASPDVSSDISDMSSSVSSLTPISDLILMPLTLINAYINGLNSSCSPVNLGNLYGTDLIIPCINIQNYLGSNLWHIIDIFVCIFMCYEIAMLFISAFDGLTSLRDDFVGLYQPRHANNDYKARHGGDN